MFHASLFYFECFVFHLKHGLKPTKMQTKKRRMVDNFLKEQVCVPKNLLMCWVFLMFLRCDSNIISRNLFCFEFNHHLSIFSPMTISFWYVSWKLVWNIFNLTFRNWIYDDFHAADGQAATIKSHIWVPP